MSVGIVLAAGGRGLRMGAPIPKQFLEIEGLPLYLHALSPFLAHPTVSAIRIGMPEDYVEETQRTIKERYPIEVDKERLAVFAGGRRRQDTVAKGIRLLSEIPGISGVLVHDAARPFLPMEVLDRILGVLKEGNAVGVGVPVSDTLWRVSDEGNRVIVREIVSRDLMAAAQTPQGGPLPLFLAALDRARREDREFTDEASLFLWAGIPVVLIEGSNRNRKITRPEDLSF